jgi:Dolichyl-phosphate-mannose-protein mannosyltransferase
MGALLASTNRWYSEVDDEYLIINSAAKSVYQTVGLFLQGTGEHEHPPLYDITLHGWLRLTAGSEHLQRLPSIFFYVLGTWIIARVARHLGGVQSQICVLILVMAWPFGFHFGRLATWYSFCFFLVSLLTLNYFNFLSRPTAKNWVCLLATSVAFVYSNYFGWVLLACLALDYVLRNVGDWRNRVPSLLLTGIILFAVYLPLLRPLLTETHLGIRSHGIGLFSIVSGVYNIYCTFVSESVAPWFWYLGIPAGIAIAAFLLTLLLRAPNSVKAFFLYFLGMFTLMTVLGIAIPKRILFISPWLILPIGVTLGSVQGRVSRRILVIALTVTASIGWYGIFSRRFYAAPHWIEPWESVAIQSADVVRNHGIVIGGNNSFFYYLTYLFPKESYLSSRGNDFAGLLPESVRIADIYDPQQWMDANRPVASTMLLVKGAHFDAPNFSTGETERWLDEHCNLIQFERKVHDDGIRWKRRFAPELGQPEWRIEVKKYKCR